MVKSARVGILYREAGFIHSFRISNGEVVAPQENKEKEKEKGIGEILDEQWNHVEHNLVTLERIEEWMKNESNGKMEKDRGYLDYFYRCLNEDSEYYYLYEQGVGWACGNTTIQSPIKSQLVKLADAIPEMEQWMNSSCSSI